MANDDTIIAMLQSGPIVGAISATGWEKYSSGIFKCSPNAQVNHAITIIGYTPDAWIIKNSWGTNFGDKGVIYISRDPKVNCGLGTAVHSLAEDNILLGALLLVLLLLQF
jgi:hypothetical protein